MQELTKNIISKYPNPEDNEEFTTFLDEKNKSIKWHYTKCKKIQEGSFLLDSDDKADVKFSHVVADEYSKISLWCDKAREKARDILGGEISTTEVILIKDYEGKEIGETLNVKITDIPAWVKGGYIEDPNKELIDDEFEESLGRAKPFIQLPAPDRLVSDYAIDLGNSIKSKDRLFFNTDSNAVIEIRNKGSSEIFEKTIPSRLLTLVEEYITPFNFVKVEGRFTKKANSMNESISKSVLNSEVFQSKLKKVDKILTVQLPILYDGKLTFPKEGYDPRFNSWLKKNSPKISNQNMPMDEAKKVLEKIYGEFCFESEKDKSHAISGLLSHFIRGLSKRNEINDFKCPLFIYEANRERSGKDYLAGITGVLFEGSARESPPISTGKNSNEEEISKTIISIINRGGFRMHSANNKGIMNSPVFESAITSPVMMARLLGGNELMERKNYIVFSISGNTGVSYSADIENRARKIFLFLGVEDANARKFKNPELHEWVLENRSLVLSALYSLVKNWVDGGMVDGKHPYTSFMEWGRICGGIMENAGYVSPCTANTVKEIGGDTLTKDMKYLYETMYEFFGDRGCKIADVRDKIIENKIDIFSYLNLQKIEDKRKFGLQFLKFVGRTLSEIELFIIEDNPRGARKIFGFRPTPEKVVLDLIDTKKTVSEEKIAELELGNAVTNLHFQEKIILRDGVWSKNE